jgi:hypothetical protein
VISGNDDAEESGGDVTLDSSDLELTDDPDYWGNDQTVGIRFQDVPVPAGATITSAYIRFTTDEPTDIETSVTIRGQAHADPPQFQNNQNNLSDRSTTTASADWNDIEPWEFGNEAHNSTDVSAVVQEIIDMDGWSSGNALAFLITGNGTRVAHSYDGSEQDAPVLNVSWTAP